MNTATRFLFGLIMSTLFSSNIALAQGSLKFDFGPGRIQNGYTRVLPSDQYTSSKGYGLLTAETLQGITHNERNRLTEDLITGDQPFYFVVNLAEGNYRVSITFGDHTSSTSTTVKAESRRLMVDRVETKAGEHVTKTFTVNVRTPSINDRDSIRLKSREFGYLNWDDKLTLEFNGSRPAVNAVEIIPVQDVTVVFLAGNSTVVDQELEPWAAWGQMIPNFFTQDVVIANFAESGETLKSFEAERRLEKISSLMKKGDYLFIEFAHNDQKPGRNHLDAFTTYKDMLKKFIRVAQEKEAAPVLVTSMHRRRFDEAGRIVNTLEDYPEAMRQVAIEENVALIDLNAMSKVLYEALGVEGSKRAFVHYPANTFPGQSSPLEDNSHFSNYGAYELARCVVEGIKMKLPQLAHHLKPDISSFDPATPDKEEEVAIPVSPVVHDVVKPDGN